MNLKSIKGIKVSQLHPGQSATIMVDKAIGVLK